MTDFLNKKKFNDLVAERIEGLIFFQEILSPVLRIRRGTESCFALLGAYKKTKSERRFLPALSPEHDWVQEGKTIYPLPSDIENLIRADFGSYDFAHLPLKDVIAICNATHDYLEICVDEDVWTPAAETAANFDGDIRPAGLAATLYPYQASGVAWMRALLSTSGGLILADEMGLGKTIQIITLFLALRPSEKRPALVVCPTSLIANWVSEIHRFAPDLSVLVHRGDTRGGIVGDLLKAEVVVTTYDTALQDKYLLSGIEWMWIVCDEAQAIKNPESQKRIAIAEIPTKYFIAVTGTPVETSLTDLWSLADLVIPGIFGALDFFQACYPDDESGALEVGRCVGPILLRRVVADVADDLPERRDVDIPLELPENLCRNYETIRAEAKEEYLVSGALVASTRLQIFCAHPWLLEYGPEDPFWLNLKQSDVGFPASMITPKLELTLSLLKEAFTEKRKVLLFATYNNCGAIIEAAISSMEEIYYNTINGKTEQSDRQDIIDEFSAWDGPALLVLNPKAAGAGLNITAATVVIHFTQVWNPAIEAQASARAHRRGQKNPVTIYRPYYLGTVEQVMIERSAMRREMAREAVPVISKDAVDMARMFAISPMVQT